MSGPNNYKTAVYKSNNLSRMVHLESAGQYPIAPDAEMNGLSWNAYARPSDCGCSSGSEQFSQPGQVGCGCIGMVASTDQEIAIYQVAHAVLKQHLRNFETRQRQLQKKKPRQYDAMRREIIKMAHIAMCTYLVMAGYSDNGYLAENNIGQADSFGFLDDVGNGLATLFGMGSVEAFNQKLAAGRGESFGFLDSIGVGLANLFGITAANLPPAEPTVPTITPATQAALLANQAAAPSTVVATPFANRFQGHHQASGFGIPPSSAGSNYPVIQPYDSNNGRGAHESFLTTYASAESFLGSTGLSITDAIKSAGQSAAAQNAQTMPGKPTISKNNAITLWQDINDPARMAMIGQTDSAIIKSMLNSIYAPGPDYSCKRAMLPAEQQYFAQILLPQVPLEISSMVYSGYANAAYIASIKRALEQIAVAPANRKSIAPNNHARDMTDMLTAVSTATNINDIDRATIIRLVHVVAPQKALSAAEIAFIRGILIGKSSFSVPSTAASASAGLQLADVANVQACLAIATMTTLDDYAVMWLNAATRRAPIHSADQERILALWQLSLKRSLVPAEIAYIQGLLCGSAFAGSPGSDIVIPDPTTNPFLAGQLAELSSAQLISQYANLMLQNVTIMQKANQATYDNTHAALQLAYANLAALQQTATNMKRQSVDMTANVGVARTDSLTSRSAASAAQSAAKASVTAFVNMQALVNKEAPLKDANMLAAQKQQLFRLSAQAESDSSAASAAQSIADAAYYRYTTSVQAQQAQHAAAEFYYDLIKLAESTISNISSILEDTQQQQTNLNANTVARKTHADEAKENADIAQKNVTAILKSIAAK